MDEIDETIEAWSEADEYKRKRHWQEVSQTLATWTLYLLFAMITLVALAITVRVAAWILP
jgi:hypothetical protein